MKYIVRTGSAVNPMLLHSTMQDEYVTDDLDKARKMFDKEVETLTEEYTMVSDLGYSPSNHEMQHAIQCEILSVDEDGEIDYIQESEYFIDAK